MKNYSLKAKLLYKFLMKERVLHLYIEEVIKQKANYRIVRDFKQEKKNVMELLDCFNDISSSLYWAETTQGHDFWEKLNDESYGFNMRYEKLFVKG